MKKLVLLVILGSVAVASIVRWTRAAEPAEATEQLVLDRIWIDHVPRSDTDIINVFVAISEQAAGLFQATSQWRGNYEVFRYEASGGELRIVYPQTRKREKVRAKATRCHEQGMDFCLGIEGASHGVKKYYSQEGWEIGRADSVDAVTHRIEALRARLEASN